MITFQREGPSPRELLERLLQSDPEFAREAEERGSLVRLPEVKTLGALVRPEKGADPNELLRSRYLCRGGSLLLVGPTGVGKSSLGKRLASLLGFRFVDADDEIEASGVLDLQSANPTAKNDFVCITPREITGRRFHLGEPQE